MDTLVNNALVWSVSFYKAHKTAVITFAAGFVLGAVLAW